MIDQAHQRPSFKFRFAHWEAFRASIDDLLRQRPRHLIPSGDRWGRPRVRERVQRGRQSVPMYQIIGCPGRFSDIVASLPATMQAAPPDAERRPGCAAPLIELYKVGEVYFVKDGNQRLDVARSRGQLFIAANVLEYIVDSAADALTEVRDLLLFDEQHSFLEATGLAQMRPNQRIVCTTLGNYPQIVAHIELHCQDLQAEWKRAIKLEIAAASWHDTIYLPIVDALRRQGVARHFASYSEADLYLWAITSGGCLAGEPAELPRLRQSLDRALASIAALAYTLPAQPQAEPTLAETAVGEPCRQMPES